MKKSNTLYIFICILIPLVIVGTVAFVGNAQAKNVQDNVHTSADLFQITDEPIQPSNPSNVVIRETARYDAPVGDNEPIAEYTGVLYLDELAGAALSFFINTSKLITAEFKDFETKQPMQMDSSCQGTVGFQQNCVADYGDRYLIVPSGRSFQYVIKSYYKPDIIKDTGFIVIFNSQSVDFSVQLDGQPAYARTDYYSRITLPQKAGIVSFAPSKQSEGFQPPMKKLDNGRYVLEWQFINRQMDSKHDPVMISVTYTYDAIFLSFTEQVYQNQQEQQQRQEEINRLNLIRQSFAVVASLAIVASLFSIFFAYLLARRKFEHELQRAKELPKREASDIEESEGLQLPVKSMFLSAIIIIPIFFAPINMGHAQVVQQDVVDWNAKYSLRKDLTLTEEIQMQLPTQQQHVYVYTNTSEAIDFNVYNSIGNKINYQTEPNRFVIPNPGLDFRYVLDRPYTVSNVSDMLVWLDRSWLEFPKNQTDGTNDPFFNVDMTYEVVLPEGAFLYSASPSDLLQPIVKENNRYHVKFKDTNRRMDAFHDVFETQVTFSFIGIIDALQNLNSDFVQVKPEQQSLDSLVKVAAQDVLIFAILGLIAPLISFFIAYWVFRRRYKKMIDRAEQEQEEQIYVEKPQIEALTMAIGPDANQRVTDAFLGHYYRAIEYISDKLGIDITRIDNSSILEVIRRSEWKMDTQLLMEVLNMGNAINPEDSVGYDQLNEMARLVSELIESIEKE